MKIKDHLNDLKDRLSRDEFGREYVPLPTKDVIELIEDHNSLYEALEMCLAIGDFNLDVGGCAQKSAHAALSKARGEAQ